LPKETGGNKEGKRRMAYLERERWGVQKYYDRKSERSKEDERGSTVN